MVARVCSIGLGLLAIIVAAVVGVGILALLSTTS